MIFKPYIEGIKLTPNGKILIVSNEPILHSNNILLQQFVKDHDPNLIKQASIDDFKKFKENFELIIFYDFIPMDKDIRQHLKKCFELNTSIGYTLFIVKKERISFLKRSEPKSVSSLVRIARLTNFNINLSFDSKMCFLFLKKLPLNQNMALHLYFSKMSELLES